MFGESLARNGFEIIKSTHSLSALLIGPDGLVTEATWMAYFATAKAAALPTDFTPSQHAGWFRILEQAIGFPLRQRIIDLCRDWFMMVAEDGNGVCNYERLDESDLQGMEDADLVDSAVWFVRMIGQLEAAEIEDDQESADAGARDERAALERLNRSKLIAEVRKRQKDFGEAWAENDPLVPKSIFDSLPRFACCIPIDDGRMPMNGDFASLSSMQAARKAATFYEGYLLSNQKHSYKPHLPHSPYGRKIYNSKDRLDSALASIVATGIDPALDKLRSDKSGPKMVHLKRFLLTIQPDLAMFEMFSGFSCPHRATRERQPRSQWVMDRTGIDLLCQDSDFKIMLDMCSLDLAETHAKLVAAAARKEAEDNIRTMVDPSTNLEKGIDYYDFTAIIGAA